MPTPIFSTEDIPFNGKKLDFLLEEEGLDLVIVCSKHNIDYLLGGYRFFFFDYMDAFALGRYLPVLVYRKGRAEQTIYVGSGLERYEQELGKFWPKNLRLESSNGPQAIEVAIDEVCKIGGAVDRIGIEAPFMPHDAAQVLQDKWKGAELVDATLILDRLRSVKADRELALVREASELVLASMMATIAACEPGMTKKDVIKRLRLEETSRNLIFEYCLLTTGTSLNRAPSDVRLKEGDILSLDSGGNYQGYIGDLCRMAILGEPDQQLQDILGFVDEVQQLSRRSIRRGGLGRDIYRAADDAIARSPYREFVEFVAHGMGLVSHEAPRLVNRSGYQGIDADRPLEAGMVLSIETTVQHPARGFIKLEDTIIVTETGWEARSDRQRGWNRAGQSGAVTATGS